eukprot:8263681-Ditylum_brightwellii.AAC.1
MDESNSWGDGFLVWCNAVRALPSEQHGINGRYLSFIVNENNGYFHSSMFSASQHFTAKSSTENVTTPALDGKTSVYDAFKSSSH